jgi:hypothetical protein
MEMFKSVPEVSTGAVIGKGPAVAIPYGRTTVPQDFPLAFARKLADDAQYKAELALSPTQLRPVDFYVRRGMKDVPSPTPSHLASSGHSRFIINLVGTVPAPGEPCR